MNNKTIPNLQEIVESVRNDLRERKNAVPCAVLDRLAGQRAAPRKLRGRLADRPGIIAEIKRSSPSRGWIRQDLDSSKTAGIYERAGACAVSVLTENRFFGGSLSDLESASAATEAVPILRKDFLLDEYMLLESRAHGADLVLLIVAVLGSETRKMIRMAETFGLASLVEVHDESELALAVDAGADIIGINNRDLTTFSVDLRTAERLLPRVPSGAVKVVESGIRSSSDLRRLAGQGADLFLIGEALVGSEDPARSIREFLRNAVPTERQEEETEWKPRSS